MKNDANESSSQMTQAEELALLAKSTLPDDQRLQVLIHIMLRLAKKPEPLPAISTTEAQHTCEHGLAAHDPETGKCAIYNCACVFPTRLQPETGGLDPAIRSLVERLNAKGVKTFQSCSGHADAECHPSAVIWIEQRALTNEQAERLSQAIGIEQVGLLFGREVVPVWEIKFTGETLSNFQVAQDAILANAAPDTAAQQAGESLNEKEKHDG